MTRMATTIIIYNVENSMVAYKRDKMKSQRKINDTFAAHTIIMVVIISKHTVIIIIIITLMKSMLFTVRGDSCVCVRPPTATVEPYYNNDTCTGSLCLA